MPEPVFVDAWLTCDEEGDEPLGIWLGTSPVKDGYGVWEGQMLLGGCEEQGGVRTLLAYADIKALAPGGVKAIRIAIAERETEK